MSALPTLPHFPGLSRKTNVQSRIPDFGCKLPDWRSLRGLARRHNYLTENRVRPHPERGKDVVYVWRDGLGKIDRARQPSLVPSRNYAGAENYGHHAQPQSMF